MKSVIPHLHYLAQTHGTSGSIKAAGAREGAGEPEIMEMQNH